MPGVGELSEIAIWRSGAETWQDFLDKQQRHQRFKRLSPWVEKSIKHLENEDAPFFSANLPSAQRWRLYNDFKENCAFLDIETTGFLGAGVITVAGLFNGKELKTFIKGKNLDQLVPELKKYPLLVTYNGSCFDLPFIERELHLSDYRYAHIDLRYVLSRLGYRGGLKQIEKQFGLLRKGPIEKLDGWLAPLLWTEYKRGKAEALNALVRYNAEDIVNLRTLMEKSFTLSIRKIPFQVQFVETLKSVMKLPDYDRSYLRDFLRRHSS
jgi:uncharacterized protein